MLIRDIATTHPSLFDRDIDPLVKVILGELKYKNKKRLDYGDRNRPEVISGPVASMVVHHRGYRMQKLLGIGRLDGEFIAGIE